MTDAAMEEVRAWQHRPLEPIYMIVYLDALIVKMRHEGGVENRVVFVAIGVDQEGAKEVPRELAHSRSRHASSVHGTCHCRTSASRNSGRPTITTAFPAYTLWSDQRAGDHAGSNAFGGTNAKYWVSDVLLDNWLGYNFSHPVYIAELALAAGSIDPWGATPEYERTPSVFDVQGSNDGGLTWATIRSITAGSWTGGNQTSTKGKRQLHKILDTTNALRPRLFRYRSRTRP